MKKKVKKQREIINEGKDASALTAAEVKKFQASLERIGTRKARGFIFMAEINKNAKSNDDSIDAFGLVFSHQVAKEEMVANLVAKLYPNPLERIVGVMQLVKRMKELA